jgi:hypothetical protein
MAILASLIAPRMHRNATVRDKGGSMGGMHMALPENTLPMMSGKGPFGDIEMGGMFTVLKVREGLARGDYRDPGWYWHPPGTVAREWTGPMPDVVGAPAAPASGEVIGTARRGGHEGH